MGVVFSLKVAVRREQKKGVVHVFLKYIVKRWTYLPAPCHKEDSTRNSDKNSLVLMRYEKKRFFLVFR
jgi:hypothetical protein